MIYLTNSFLGHNYKIEEADVCVIGIPFDSTSINPGSGHGPTAIRQSLKMIEGYDPVAGFDVFERLKVCDLGDIEVVFGSYELTAERIKQTISEVREKNPGVFFLFFGGEHLISLPVVEALRPDTVLDFDAHADLRGDYLGNRFSHATWASHVVGEFNLVQRGVRSFSQGEKDMVERIKNNEVTGSTYLTVDMDVFDPAIAPDTGLPEPGGWDFDEFCSNLDLIGSNDLVGADVVEVAPRCFNSQTAVLAANVVKGILGVVAQGK